MSFLLTSPAFEHNRSIPARYTCDGESVHPPLHFAGVPAEAKSLVLTMDDPDAPEGVFDHWIVFNIPPAVQVIEEGKEVPGVAGRNAARGNGYMAPCPPFGTHRYVFRLYALDARLTIPEGSTKEDLELAMQEHILAESELIGLYARQ